MFALVFLLPATTGATAVLSKQVVANCGVQDDAGVRSSATSVVVVVVEGAVEDDGDLDSATLVSDSDAAGDFLLHKVV